MNLVKKLKGFLKTKPNQISFSILVLTFIALCISFFIREFSYQIIAIMFSLIAVENFIKHFVFIEDIKNKLDNLIKQDSEWLKAIETIEEIKGNLDNLKVQGTEGIKAIKVNDFIGEITDFLLKSQKEFIMIGGSMLKFAGSIDLIIKHSEDNDVKVRILALNIENEEIRTQYKKMLNRENIPYNLDHLKELKNRKNIEIRTYEFLPTAYYFANDLNFSNGIIRTAHISYGVAEEFKYSHILVDSSDKHWYESYKNQIERLWEKGISWS